MILRVKCLYSWFQYLAVLVKDQQLLYDHSLKPNSKEFDLLLKFYSKNDLWLKYHKIIKLKFQKWFAYSNLIVTIDINSWLREKKLNNFCMTVHWSINQRAMIYDWYWNSTRVEILQSNKLKKKGNIVNNFGVKCLGSWFQYLVVLVKVQQSRYDHFSMPSSTEFDSLFKFNSINDLRLEYHKLITFKFQKWFLDPNVSGVCVTIRLWE